MKSPQYIKHGDLKEGKLYRVKLPDDDLGCLPWFSNRLSREGDPYHGAAYCSLEEDQILMYVGYTTVSWEDETGRRWSERHFVFLQDTNLVQDNWEEFTGCLIEHTSQESLDK